MNELRSRIVKYIMDRATLDNYYDVLVLTSRRFFDSSPIYIHDMVDQVYSLKGWRKIHRCSHMSKKEQTEKIIETVSGGKHDPDFWRAYKMAANNITLDDMMKSTKQIEKLKQELSDVQRVIDKIYDV